ncbi:GatB/YqeY domain-containing protein [Saccharomonospora azurea]|nr:GatB/YqeY domain-containing protein [Saccharomonospora azurea]
MRDALRRDLTAALKARDRVAIDALRSALGALDNAEAVPVDHAAIRGGEPSSEHIAGAASGVGSTESRRRELTEAQVRSIVRQQVDERQEAATEYDRLGRTDHAERLRAEADVLDRHLS